MDFENRLCLTNSLPVKIPRLTLGMTVISLPPLPSAGEGRGEVLEAVG
jgi:hypothetical protein